MSMVITHNISAINTQRNLGINNRNLGKSLEKLSSGYRINVGADGPADLIISEQLRAQGQGLTRAVRNTQEAMNVIGIAEGALNEMNEILKKMRSLALHAANSGITSPLQVQANQQELDSGIQTIDRIANTTKYSDQLLLNGSKQIVFGRTTTIRSTQNNAIVDTALSRLDQVFKRDGFSVSIAFNGAENPDATTGLGVAAVDNEARKAYFEIDTNNDKADVDLGTRALDRAQSFILTGEKGSRLFNFDEGATMGQIARTINNVADSTGVDATLIFASDQTIDSSVNLNGSDQVHFGGSGAVRTNGDMVISNNTNSLGNNVITDLGGAIGGLVLGQNTDGLGRIFVKITGDNSYELYKDESLSDESLIGHGTEGFEVVEDNSSGITTFQIDDILDSQAGHVSTIYAAGIEGTNAGVSYSGGFATAATANSFDQSLSFFGGVKLGQNTDSEGKIYFKTVMSAGSVGTVYAYNNARMADSDLVAKSAEGISLDPTATVVLAEVRNNEDTTGTGLAISLATTASGFTATTDTELTGSIQFSQLGVRISSTEYGSDASIRIQQNSGTVWQYYEQANSASETMVDAANGSITVQQTGHDAELTINGQRVQTDGLELELSTQDVTASLVFNAGKTGSTTIAQVGYADGSIFTRAESLTDTDSATDTDGDGIQGAFLTNAGHSTLEVLEHYQGGMQFQLGEGAGDQERTVYGIQSMGVANLGLTRFVGIFDETKSVIEEKMLSLQDILGGGTASLSNDPIRALSIIDQAVNDVSSLRARLGATQSNMLQTNVNALNVAIENIAKTESAIRDADMAYETTEFTKNQVLQNAATSMLAQANAQTQAVLQLLG